MGGIIGIIPGAHRLFGLRFEGSHRGRLIPEIGRVETARSLPNFVLRLERVESLQSKFSFDLFDFPLGNASGGLGGEGDARKELNRELKRKIEGDQGYGGNQDELKAMGCEHESFTNYRVGIIVVAFKIRKTRNYG